MSFMKSYLKGERDGSNYTLPELNKHIKVTVESLDELTLLQREALAVQCTLFAKSSLESSTKAFLSPLLKEMNKTASKYGLESISLEDDGKEKGIIARILDWIKKLIRNIVNLVKKGIMWVIKLFSMVDKRLKDMHYRMRELTEHEFEEARNKVYEQYVNEKKWYWVDENGKMLSVEVEFNKIEQHRARKNAAIFDPKYGGFKLDESNKTVTFNIEGFLSALENKNNPESLRINHLLNGKGYSEVIDKSLALAGKPNFIDYQEGLDMGQPMSKWMFIHKEMVTWVHVAERVDSNIAGFAKHIEKDAAELEALGKKLEALSKDTTSASMTLANNVINVISKEKAINVKMMGEFSKWITDTIEVGNRIYDTCRTEWGTEK